MDYGGGGGGVGGRLFKRERERKRKQLAELIDYLFAPFPCVVITNNVPLLHAE